MKKVAEWEYKLEEMRRSVEFGPLQIKRNVFGRMHCETGPAYISPTCVAWYIEGRRHGMYADIHGTKIYFFNDILIPAKYVDDKESLTVEEILNHKNAEVRYVGIEIYGYERMEEEGRLAVIHQDKKTKAKLIQLKSSKLEEPLTLVMVYNSTPEPNGTYKRYFLRVPPTMKTCQEAVAWTFRCEANGYHPNVET
jgi:hypothetical protein